MSAVMILFAFTLSLVINFIEKMVNPADDRMDQERLETNENFAAEEPELSARR